MVQSGCRGFSLPFLPSSSFPADVGPSGTSALPGSTSSSSGLGVASDSLLISLFSPSLHLPYFSLSGILPFLKCVFPHHQFGWWALLCSALCLLELPVSSTGQSLVSSHRSHPASEPTEATEAPLYQNLDADPQYTSHRCLPDVQTVIRTFSVFPVKVWKEYSDREVFNHSMRNMHQSSCPGAVLERDQTSAACAWQGSLVISLSCRSGGSTSVAFHNPFVGVSPSERSQDPASSLQPSKYPILCIS